LHLALLKESPVLLLTQIQGSRSATPMLKILNTNLGATTDGNGYFEIVLPDSKTYNIRASMIGYQSIVKPIEH
jgi:hypothetical protein